MSQPILSTHALSVKYGDFQALFDVDFEIAPGEIVALIGANGAGKSTMLNSIIGLLSCDPEMIKFDGEAVGDSAPHTMVGKGLAMVPEGRRLFTGMSIEDNLRVAMDHASKVGGDSGSLWTLERLYDLFPVLVERRKTLVENLSGGQQQMVAIGRALLNQPRLLLCDELSLGLAPTVIREIYKMLPEISKAGTALVLVEQDVSLAQSASSRLYCMLEGRITLTGKSDEIDRDTIAGAYFGVDHAVA